jgi:hypothetical protein
VPAADARPLLLELEFLFAGGNSTVENSVYPKKQTDTELRYMKYH